MTAGAQLCDGSASEGRAPLHVPAGAHWRFDHKNDLLEVSFPARRASLRPGPRPASRRFRRKQMDLLDRPTSVGDITITPLDAPLGARVHCGPMDKLSPAERDVIHQAWLDNLILVFPG